MLKLSNLKVALQDDRLLNEIAAEALKLPLTALKDLKIIAKSLDARHKDKIVFVYSLVFAVEDEHSLLKRQRKNLTVFRQERAENITCGDKMPEGRIIVVGAGPAGLMAALLLSEYGYKPLLLERGLPIEERSKAVADFWRNGRFSPVGNVQFGEGGAGAFSDGKLTTRISDPATALILKRFVKAGAPPQIIYENKPHIGTDLLRAVVKNIADSIRQNGGEIRYLSRFADIEIKDGRLKTIVLDNGEKIECAALILAVGHSARDTYRMLFARGFGMQAKPFSIGVRIEHPQEFIDKAQYGALAGHPKLTAADYALVWHGKATGRNLYSFCMCPGGVVVAAASEEGQVVTNGMSFHKRDSGVANSALVTSVSPADFGEHPLAGISFQERWEKLAFSKGGADYNAPAQTVGSFLHKERPVLGRFFLPTYRPGVSPVDLREVLPPFVTNSLTQALADFDHKIKGFAHTDAVLTGVETRTSAPLRILREQSSRQSVKVQGVYPAGEGAGYAGGIVSAALDGYYTALAVMKEYKSS